jgi:hypothetical protein
MKAERLGVPRRLLGPLLWGAALLTSSCDSAREGPTGGETHFLKPCDPEADACGGDLACVCGVCTLTCTETAACAGLPAASCAPPRVADACEVPTSGYCDVTCTADADCAALPAAPRCTGGVCRSSSGPEPCAASEVTGNEVVIVGDSFFAAGHDITAFLEDMARKSSALSAGERYRDHSSLLGNTLALLGSGIEDQYAAAAAESPVSVVIMNGGGADVLLGSCDDLAPDCPLLVEAAAAASSLFERMASDGVQHVVYAFYPDPSDATLRAELDTLRPLLASACESSPTACHWVDLRTTFADQEALYLDVEGTTPTPEGAQAAAAAIGAVLQRQCIAQ